MKGMIWNIHKFGLTAESNSMHPLSTLVVVGSRSNGPGLNKDFDFFFFKLKCREFEPSNLDRTTTGVLNRVLNAWNFLLCRFRSHNV